MKLQRYDIDTGEYGNGYSPVKDDWAEWVRSDDVEKLEELNREMMEVLKEVEWLEIWDDYVDGPLYDCPVCRNLAGKGHSEDCTLGKIIVKVEGMNKQ